MVLNHRNRALGLTLFAMVLPISVLYSTNDTRSEIIVIGLFYSYFHNSISGYGIMEYPSDTTGGDTSFFTGDPWTAVWGSGDAIHVGNIMMLLWELTLVFAVLGFLITIRKPKAGGVFLLLAAITGLLFTLFGRMSDWLYYPIPIPIASIFYFWAAIVALGEKNSEQNL